MRFGMRASIVGSGRDGAVLHYPKDDRTMNDGEIAARVTSRSCIVLSRSGQTAGRSGRRARTSGHRAASRDSRGP